MPRPNWKRKKPYAASVGVEKVIKSSLITESVGLAKQSENHGEN